MKDVKNAKGLTEAQFLASYKPGNYEKPSVTVDMLIFTIDEKLKNLKILLIQRKDHPFINCWAFPGGFIKMNESAYESACRELKEETGLENVYMEQLYTMSKPDRDPRMRIIDIAYMAFIPQREVNAGDDAKDAKWFDITFTENSLELYNSENNVSINYSLEEKVFRNGIIQLINYIPISKSEERLAFDHAELLLEGLTRLRNKVNYTDIAFNLLPEEFTLPDLQRVYEVILGQTLYKANFRDKVKEKITELDYKIKASSGKMSQAFKYRAEK